MTGLDTLSLFLTGSDIKKAGSDNAGSLSDLISGENIRDCWHIGTEAFAPPLGQETPMPVNFPKTDRPTDQMAKTVARNLCQRHSRGRENYP